MDIQKVASQFGKLIVKNSPQILTGLGCAGLVSTAILTGRATIKATTILQEEEAGIFSDHGRPLTPSEKIKHTWKCYISAGIVGATSIACIIGANSVNTQRNAALAALYSISETAFREYKTKVVEEIGKPKEAKIRREITKDTIIANPIGDRTIIITGHGDVLCYDKLCDRYFYSSYEFIRQKVNDLNYSLRSEMWLDLNDLYDALGLKNTGLGDQCGFDMDRGYIEIDYDTEFDPEVGKPCLVIDTKVHPKNYQN